MSEIYLLHGDNEASINDAKLALISKHLSPELRSHNYIEFSSTAPRWSISLSSIHADLISELSMLSLLPDTKRVVVAYNLSELYQKARRRTKTTDDKKKSTHLEYLLEFLSGPFQHVPNVLILVAIEDHGKRRSVNKKSPLYSLVKKIGLVQEMSDKPLAYRLTDALLTQNTSQCIKVFRQWFTSHEKARQSIFRTVLNDIHLLLQAKILNAKESALATDKRLKEILFPKEFQGNILQQHSYRRKKFQDAALLYSTTQLSYALKYLVRLNTTLYPVQQDRYVPDLQVMFELFLLRLTTQTLNPNQI